MSELGIFNVSPFAQRWASNRVGRVEGLSLRWSSGAALARFTCRFTPSASLCQAHPAAFPARPQAGIWLTFRGVYIREPNLEVAGRELVKHRRATRLPPFIRVDVGMQTWSGTGGHRRSFDKGDQVDP